MAKKIIAAFCEGQPLDLNQGFAKHLLQKDSLKDESFCRKELDWDKIQLIVNQVQDKKPKWSVLK